jgi:ADP-ribose pyrophosphatase YjhB (NUDIX family)
MSAHKIFEIRIVISFDTKSHRLNLRAAAVIFHNEHVLLHQVEGNDFWRLPGGRVEPGEHASQTVIREMKEEVGASVQIEKALCIVENFFSYRERPHHEIGLYLIARLEPGSTLLNVTVLHSGSEGDKRLTFMWVDRLIGNDCPKFMYDPFRFVNYFRLIVPPWHM